MFMQGDLRLFAALLIIYGYGYILYFRNEINPVFLDLLVEGEWMLATFFLILWL